MWACGGSLRHRLVDFEARDAVCNDGTVPLYDVHRGPTEPDRWIVYFKGGSGCFTEPERELRWEENHDLMSSDDPRWGEVRFFGGLLSADTLVNPEFAGWSTAWLLHCSSDGWSGDQAGGDELGEWHFRGANVATALFEDLADPALLPEGSLLDAEQLLIVGSAAGASGLRAHVDRLAGWLDDVAGRDVDVRALHDAGWFGDVRTEDAEVWLSRMSKALDPARLAKLGLSEADVEAAYAQGDADALYAILMRYGMDHVNAYEVLDEDCVAATSTEERRTCIEPYVASSYIDAPTFVYMDQHDPVGMGRVGLDSSDVEDQDAFPAGVRSALGSAAARFSFRVASHEAVYDDALWSGSTGVNIDGSSYRQTFADWYLGGEAPCRITP